MEKDIEKIRKEIEEFMRKYNVSVTVETTCYGKMPDMTLINPKAHLIIHS